MKRIAIVGMSCRLPGADSPEALWTLLCNEGNAITQVPSTRWNAEEFYDADPKKAGAMYTIRGGFLDQVDCFDAPCFGIAPREAIHMDPQQRLMLELAWEAFEDGGMPHQRLAGSATGVFFGFGAMEYALTQLRHPKLIDAYTNTGYFPSIISNRVSYVFDLRGPSLSLDTACSSSLVAVHLACESLRKGECNMALAGGVSLMIDPVTTVAFCKLSALSPHGRCKTFDAGADGYVRGEGAGIVLLKRYEDALRDGDRVYAVILGEAVNQDGKSNGLTAPNRIAQEQVLRQAYASAEFPPSEVQYLEAHGTGTYLGDPIELSAVGNVMRQGRSPQRPLLVGSLKTNIGHLEAAAGVAGLIKLTKCIEKNKIPAHLHFEQPNPHIPFEELQTRVVTKLQPWPEHAGPRVGGISSFGFGGTNAHVVLSEPFPEGANVAQSTSHGLNVNDSASSECTLGDKSLLLLSAREPNALRELAQRYIEFLGDESSTTPWTSICNAAAWRRTHFEYRMSVVAADSKAAVVALKTQLDSLSSTKALTHPQVAFLFTGQGAQYVGMGRGLYERESVFRNTLDRCDELLRPILPESLLQVMLESHESFRLNQTAFTQPAMFALQWALAEQWKSWGVEPALVLGHSIGEIAGACAAGLMDWESGLHFAARRGALMQELRDAGGMLALIASRQWAAEFLAEHRLSLSIAASNGPNNTVISGALSELERAFQIARSCGKVAVRLNVSHAFHSDLMEPILAPLLTEASRIEWRPSRIPFIANLSGEVIHVGSKLAPQYFQAHARSEVRFEESVAALLHAEPALCIEIGPDTTLLEMAKRCDSMKSVAWQPSLQRGKDDRETMLNAVAKAYAVGAPLRYETLVGKSQRFCSLPRYPFQRTKYWESMPIGLKSDHSPGAPLKPAIDENSFQHPLLGSPIDSPICMFSQSLRSDSPAWLQDHQVMGRVVLPGAGMLEMALSAVRSRRTKNDESPITLREVRFLRPVLLNSTEPCQLQTANLDGKVSISLKEPSKKADSAKSSSRWRTISTAKVEEADHDKNSQDSSSGSSAKDLVSKIGSKIDLRETLEGLDASVSAHDLYEQLASTGLEYGPNFRRVEKVWQNENECWGLIRCESIDNEGRLFFSPMVLDACFHVVACLLDGDELGPRRNYIPVSVGELSLQTLAADAVYCRARLSQDNVRSKRVMAELEIFAPDGTCIGYLERLGFAPSNFGATQAAQPSAAHVGLTWKSKWRVRTGATKNQVSLQRQQFVCFGNSTSATSSLGRILVERGHSWRIHSWDEAQSPTLFQQIAKSSTQITVLLFSDCEPANAEQSPHEETWQHTTNACKQFHQWLYNAANISNVSRVVLITRGGQAVSDRGDDVRVTDHTLAGWFRTVRMESSRWRCDHLDLDPSIAWLSQTEWVADELITPSQEFDIAWRDSLVYERAFEWIDSASLQQADSKVLAQEDQKCLALGFTAKGSLDYLHWAPAQRTLQSPNEIEIQVRSAGLNFRDVLNVLGVYPGDAGPLGGECSGVVSALGSNVSGWRVGDPVVAIAWGSFSEYTTTHAGLVAAKPKHLSFAEAACLPIATLTASIALNHFGRIQPGDRVLIHAAAGGVGLAAVRIAIRMGAEVFATAGSEEKRQLLRSLGVKHVANSRSLGFASEFSKIAGHQGIDIVLNSLSGETIPSSLGLLNQQGRFIEIGKIGTWTADQVSSKFPELEYHQFDLAEWANRDPQWIGDLLKKELASFQNPDDRPRIASVPSQRARDAFRWMSQGKHTGKIAITLPTRVWDASQTLFESDVIYVVTGALGAIGQQLVPWMIEQGAKHIKLATHRNLNDAELVLVARWNQMGAHVAAHQLNTVQSKEVANWIVGLTQQGQPIRGFLHLAGVLRDGLAARGSWDDYQHVLEAKALTAWNFHQALRSHDLQYFVAFSSIASAFGSPGQANYSAANSFVDALVQHRRSMGLAAQTVQWGPWAGRGMAERFHDRGLQMGIRGLDAATALTELESILRADIGQATVVDLDMTRFSKTMGRSLSPGLLQSMQSDGQAAVAPPTHAKLQGWKERIHASLPPERMRIITEFLTHATIHVLGLPERTSVDVRQPLRELGLDSLMAVEMKNLLVDVTHLTLDATVLFDHPTIEALAKLIASRLNEQAESERTQNELKVPNLLDETSSDWSATSLETASTEEIAAELARELAQLRREEIRTL